MKNAQALQMLRDGIAKLTSSESFQRFLSFRSRFHRYSWPNSLLISFQRPDSTLVAGYRRWESMGRHVRLHEKALHIWAPLICSHKIEKNGETKTVQSVCGYRTVCVFDVSQTDGKPLPAPPKAELLSGNEDGGLYERLSTFLSKHGVTVRLEKPVHEGANGEYSQTEKVVRIDPALSPCQRAKTLAHEAAHVILHTGEDISRPTAETEAEAVSFLVCRHGGIDAGKFSFAYISTWSSGDMSVLEHSLNRIERAYRELVQCDAATEAA